MDDVAIPAEGAPAGSSGPLGKKEAAAFLGVSVRALERYTSQGRIGARYQKGKTRPVAVYDAAALGALKAELAGRHAPRVATMPPATPTETVSFRLDSYYLERLGERARQRGMSPGACARLLVVAALEGVGPEGISDEVAALREGLARFYGNFATAVYTLLIEAGRADEAQAEAFVRDYLLADAGDAAAADEEGEE